MKRDEILPLAWETAGNPEFWDDDDIVEFAESVARRAALAEVSMHGKCIENAEPVAWLRKNSFRFNAEIEPQDDCELPLYTLPPLREWVGLTETDRLDAFDEYLHNSPDGRWVYNNAMSYSEDERDAFDAGWAAAEAALKEKNRVRY